MSNVIQFNNRTRHTAFCPCINATMKIYFWIILFYNFDVSDYSWRDLTGRFDDVSGDIPDGDLIDEFYEDFRRDINSQGIDYKYIKF